MTLGRIIVYAVCMLLAVKPVLAQEVPPLAFGVFPYLSHHQLIGQFTPLRDYLQQNIGRKLTLVTAPDYVSFRERTRDGEYDIILTAPHLGRLAEVEDRYRRIAITRYRVHAVIVVKKDSPILRLADLRGKSLAITPSAAIISSLATVLLRNRGLQPGRDVTLQEYGNTQNTLVGVLRGDHDAGVVGFAAWNSAEQKEQLRVIAKTEEVPGLLIMAHPRVPAPVIKKLRKAILSFGDTAEGRAYFAATSHGAWLPVDDAVMRSLDVYLRQAGD